MRANGSALAELLTALRWKDGSALAELSTICRRTALRWRSCRGFGSGKKERRETAHFRVTAKFTLNEAEVVNMEHTLNEAEVVNMERTFGAAYGSEFLKDMRTLCDQYKDGRQDALSRWLGSWAKRVPAAGILV